MKTFSIFILVLLFLTGCQREKNRLSFDEIAFVEYRVGLIPCISGRPDPKQYAAKEMNLKMPYFINEAGNYVFVPQRELRINRDGNALFFIHSTLDSTRNGFFRTTLPSVSVKSLNSLLDSLKLSKIDSSYYKENPPRIYDGSYCYISFLKDSKKVFSYIYFPKDAPKDIQRYIQFLKGFTNRISSEPIDDERQFDEINKQVFNSKLSTPFKVIAEESTNSEYIPSIQELKKQ
ncbi:MAG: hypothetical protein ACM34K_14710 [Bacillota bacterium]